MKEIQYIDAERIAVVHRQYGLIYVLGYAWLLWYEHDRQRAYRYYHV